ncbi:MAG: oxygenase MpaB family protein [Vicinamibacterales bacterium]
MRNVLGTETRLDDAFLDGMRQTVDPPADAVARSLVERDAHRLVGELMKNRQMWDPDGEPSRLLPEDVRSYMKAASALPAWRDERLINEAEAFFLQYGLASATLLACASLPQCYVMKYGTEVLAYTKFLQVEPTRRIRETAQMVMDVMCPGGLRPNGRGIRATMKVRVMHAIVRHMIDHDPRARANPADPALRARFGRPVNQEDMVYTLMTFSWVVVDGFRVMGYRMTDLQRDAYIHCWNVVGVLMGIREELLPARSADAEELFSAIRRRQHGESEAGRKLTSALLKSVEDSIPGRLHDPLPAALTRKLVGDPTADALGVARATGLTRVRLAAILGTWALAAGVLRRWYSDRPFRFASEKLHKAILVRMGRMGGVPFDVPPEFVERWFPDEKAESGRRRQEVGVRR